MIAVHTTESMAVILTAHDLTDLASVILATTDRRVRDAWIQTLHKTTVGAEALRLIVRDNVGGAGSTVADALWINI